MKAALDPDAYIRHSVAAGRSMREIARDIGCDRVGVYRRIRAMGLHGRAPVLEPHEERAVEALVDQIGRPDNPLHAVVIRTVAETVLAAKCGSSEETEKMVIAVADAMNRLLRNPDVSVAMKSASSRWSAIVESYETEDEECPPTFRVLATGLTIDGAHRYAQTISDEMEIRVRERRAHPCKIGFVCRDTEVPGLLAQNTDRDCAGRPA